MAGANWDAANAAANALLASEPSSFFVHPFEQPSTWDGHASLVDEVKQQLKEDFGENGAPAAFVTCVGGGGLAVGKGPMIEK